MKDSQRPYSPITLGFTLRAMFEWEAEIALKIKQLDDAGKEPEPGSDSLENRLYDIPHDWICGGLFRLAEAVAEVCLDSELKYDEDVFEYRFCDRDEHSIWLPVFLRMTKREWNDIMGGEDVPESFKQGVVEQLRKYGLVEQSA